MAGTPDAVFAVSEQVRRHSIEVDRIDPHRVQTIYNGLDLSAWDAPSRPAKAPGEFLVTTVGNIRRVKGHDLFIKAAAAIMPQFPKASFSIAGDVLDPVYFAELQSLVRDLGLSEHFRFEGGVTDLRRHLAAADIFVLPSRSEGFSNALVEAMAASLPVVATRRRRQRRSRARWNHRIHCPIGGSWCACERHRKVALRSCPGKNNGRSGKGPGNGQIHD